jgi:MFS transporter, NHS family, xanthosine permease
MGIKQRLVVLNFLQFFVWGSWLISLGGYMIVTLHFSGGQVGSIYATMGLASLFMPTLMGIVADRWVNAERVLGLCHMTGAMMLFWASRVTDPSILYWIMLLNAMAYMPTVALNNAVSYIVLENRGFKVVKDFPLVRVWGTVGFIISMWFIDLCGWTVSRNQLIFSSCASLLLGIYCFTLPGCPPRKIKKKRSFLSTFGLDALVLFRRKRMIVFFVFAMLLGAALQITNTFGQPFLHDFTGRFPGSFAVTHPGILMSISQVSETLFILAIPFFLYRFGIKKVILMSIFAWVFRFGLFAVGNPGRGFILLVLSMIIYGMAFDFFNITGSIFVEKEADVNIRASAQGLFMMMANGVGAFLGGTLSGWVVDYFTMNGVKNWPYIWFTFAAYMLILGTLFPIFFKYKHNPADVEIVK